jgi:cell division protein FtsX
VANLAGCSGCVPGGGADDPEVRTTKYVTQSDAFTEFTALFGSDEGPNIEARDLPSSYRVKVKRSTSADGERQKYTALPGVKEVIIDPLDVSSN